jgi:D-xylose transport system permease protein
VALAGVVAGIAQVNWGWSAGGLSGAIQTVILAIAVGGAAGFLTGGLVAILRIAPFVITLGVMVIARGLALILSHGASISPMGDSLIPLATEYLSPILTIVLAAVFLFWFVFKSRQKLADALFPFLTFALLAYAFIEYRGFPILVLFLIATLGVVGFLLSQTTFGRSVYAIGSNEKAAPWAGVPVRKVVWWVYGIMGLLSGLAGVLLTARLNGADPNAGQLFELDAIAAVVIGGTSLKGGVGNIMGSFIGALTIATLNNGMDLLNVPSFYQMVFKGLIIIAAVSLDKGQRQT